MKEEIKSKLAELVKLCEQSGDEEKMEVAKSYAKDAEIVERVESLMKDSHYAATVADLEEANQKTKDALVMANLDRVTDNQLRAAISDYQSNLRVINSLKGIGEDELEKRLDLSLKTLAEEKEASA